MPPVTTPTSRRETERGPEQDTRLGPRHEAAFTLIEIIIVLAVLGVLAGVAVPTVDLLQSKARSRATVEAMSALEDALDGYFEDHLRYPDALADLEAGGYVRSRFASGDVFLDGWGHPLVYSASGITCTLESFGPDQIDSARNYELTLDGTPHLRARTRDDMKTIHVGLRSYESLRLEAGLQPLPSLWYHPDAGVPSALGILIEDGYLPNRIRYATDAWGEVYEYGGSPADFVSSSNLP